MKTEWAGRRSAPWDRPLFSVCSSLLNDVCHLMSRLRTRWVTGSFGFEKCANFCDAQRRKVQNKLFGLLLGESWMFTLWDDTMDSQWRLSHVDAFPSPAFCLSSLFLLHQHGNEWPAESNDRCDHRRFCAQPDTVAHCNNRWFIPAEVTCTQRSQNTCRTEMCCYCTSQIKNTFMHFLVPSIKMSHNYQRLNSWMTVLCLLIEFALPDSLII